MNDENNNAVYVEKCLYAADQLAAQAKILRDQAQGATAWSSPGDSHAFGAASGLNAAADALDKRAADLRAAAEAK